MPQESDTNPTRTAAPTCGLGSGSTQTPASPAPAPAESATQATMPAATLAAAAADDDSTSPAGIPGACTGTAAVWSKWNSTIALSHVALLAAALGLIAVGHHWPGLGFADLGIFKFASGFFYSIFFLLLMDVVSFLIPHIKNKTRPPILSSVGGPRKEILLFAGVLIALEGVMSWFIGWGPTTSIIFGLGATLTGVIYEYGLRKFMKWALD